MGDGAQVAVQVLLRHADAVVGHGDGAGILVEGDVDAELILRQLDAGVGEAFEVQLVDGVRRVGDELAQEDLAVGVDGVDHQVEQLLALCLELAHRCGASFPFVLGAAGPAARREGASLTCGDASLQRPPAGGAPGRACPGE